ncbi:MAG TPA: response regulator transcription factor [Bacteroidales bacterium]|jgi:DNA-binding response OmpR family regulator|nr:response regulator transcription factor [Bacteroidales bacterium]HNV95422.1 response regulator transcription factor [Bacteroidales bacterium]HOU97812.1 response regulator transcription factor [Bacteroidales bacterium]
MELTKAHILLAEDDDNLGMLLQEYLNAKGYKTELFPNGEAALKAFKNSSYDLCLLDVMMPLMDGFTLAKEIRIINDKVPIVFLTAKSLKNDVVEGFKIGADDYITKPFSMEELLFRVEAILRRTKGLVIQEKSTYAIGDYIFNADTQELDYKGNIIKLTTKESELLLLLCQNINNVLDRNFALKKIWLDESYYNARSMDVYITRLRKHLSEDPRIEIMNVHSKGFKLILHE